MSEVEGGAAPLAVEVRNLQNVPVREEAMVAAARHARALGAGPLDCLSLVLVDEDRVARLDQRFLGRQEPTDVIAFPAEETEEGWCGEVIVTVPVAQRQAAERGHSLEKELAILAAHGTLHALDYRDDTDPARAEMERLQEAAVERAWAELRLT
jgi:probable rRNA maturation factor